MRILIPCSGLASRLLPLTSEIPKILVNIGNSTGLKLIYEYWNSYEELIEIALIIHPKFEKITKAYIEKYNLYKIKLYYDEESLGSYKTITSFIENNLEYKQNVFFNWSDIIPVSKINIPEKNTIFINGNLSRYYANGSFLEKKNNGNVIGLYYASNLNKEFFEFDKNKNLDFVDCFKFEQTIDIDKIIDFGDFDKLNYENSKIQKSRDFNEIKIYENYVEKIPLNEHGIKLQSLEKLWYFSQKEENSKFLPKIYNSKNCLKLEKINGQEFKHLENINIDNLLNAIRNFHKTSNIKISKEIFEEDLYIEIIEKSQNRFNSIKSYLEAFGKITKIEDIEIYTFEKITNFIFNYIKSNKCDYVNIHGDLNFSNIFLTDDNQIKFIDPRGYFGKTKLYGLANYDIAKIIYGCSGYDNFNDNNNFKYNKNKENLYIEISPKIENYLNLIEKYNLEIDIKLWLAIIWMNLGGYLQNNPIKAIISYYYGLYLGTLFINEIKNKIK